MTIALVAHTHQPGNGSTTQTVTPEINTTGCDFKLGIWNHYTGGGADPSTVVEQFGGVDDTDNDWTFLPEIVNGVLKTHVAFCANPVNKGPNNGIAISAGGIMYGPAFFSAWSGLHLTDPYNGDLDDAEYVTTDQVVTPTITPAADGSLVVTFVALNTASVPGVDAPFTLLDGQGLVSGQSQGGAVAYEIQGGAATPRFARWAETGVYDTRMALILSFKPSAGGVLVPDVNVHTSNRAMNRAMNRGVS